MVKMVNLWFNHEVQPQNNHFDHRPWGRFQDVSGHGQIFWPLTMGQIPGCHGHPPGPPYYSVESLQPVLETFRYPNSQKRDLRDSNEGEDEKLHDI